MQIVLDRFSTTSQAPTLLVLLPPAQASLADFVDHGFIDSARSGGLHTDILLVDVGYADLMARTVATQINDQIAQASHSVAYREIWVSGISLGAFNALHFAAAYATTVTGLHLKRSNPAVARWPGPGRPKACRVMSVPGGYGYAARHSLKLLAHRCS